MLASFICWYFLQVLCVMLYAYRVTYTKGVHLFGNFDVHIWEWVGNLCVCKPMCWYECITKISPAWHQSFRIVTVTNCCWNNFTSWSSIHNLPKKKKTNWMNFYHLIFLFNYILVGAGGESYRIIVVMWYDSVLIFNFQHEITIFLCYFVPNTEWFSIVLSG